MAEGHSALALNKSTALPQRNYLLASLSRSDFAVIEPRLEATSLPVRMQLQEPRKTISWVYFPSIGIASVVVAATRGRKIEVGIIGRDGMTGLSVVLDRQRSQHEIFIQIAGEGNRIAADALRGVMAQSPSIHRAFLHYVDMFMAQTASTALANGKATVAERLARWLLMALDRQDGNEVHLTHEFLSLMLGVRRAGVTVAMQEVEGLGLIETSRSVIRIVNRPKLDAFADGFYDVPDPE